MVGIKRIYAAFYETAAGGMPVREWLLSLDKDADLALARKRMKEIET